MSVRIRICYRPQGSQLQLPTSTNSVTMRVLMNSLRFSSTKGGWATESPASDMYVIRYTSAPPNSNSVFSNSIFWNDKKKETSSTFEIDRKKMLLMEFNRAFEFGSTLALHLIISNLKFPATPYHQCTSFSKQNNLAPMRRRIPILGVGLEGKLRVQVDAFAHHCRIFLTPPPGKLPTICEDVISHSPRKRVWFFVAQKRIIRPLPAIKAKGLWSWCDFSPNSENSLPLLSIVGASRIDSGAVYIAGKVTPATERAATLTSRLFRSEEVLRLPFRGRLVTGVIDTSLFRTDWQDGSHRSCLQRVLDIQFNMYAHWNLLFELHSRSFPVYSKLPPVRSFTLSTSTYRVGGDEFLENELSQVGIGWLLL